MPFDIIDNFLQLQKHFYDKQIAKIEQTHTKKFNSLYNNLINTLNFNTDEKAIVNLTDVIVPSDIRWLLSLGPKFALPSKHDEFPLFDFIADTEALIQTIDEVKNKDIARAKITNILSNANCIHKRENIIDLTIDNIYKDTKKFFTEHKELIVVSSDKGKATVIMSRHNYEKKVAELLSDTNTYKILPSNPLNKLQFKNNKFIHRLYNIKAIDKKEKFMMSTYNTTDPKIYALPKIHKPNVPFRPVTAFINTPSSPLSNMLSPILKKLCENDPYNIKNSFVFKDKITAVTVDSTEIMVSFDVVSLFTNIPVPLAVEVVGERWDEICSLTSIPKMLFFEMLDFCLIDGNYCVFRDIVYRQTFGMPMGNPLSTIIADIIMKKLLDSALSKLENKPKIFVKYVDDIFTIIPTDSLDSTLAALNSFHPRLMFTYETELDNKIPFLDTMVHRGPGGMVETNWYRKDVSSNRVLNFYSNHPQHQKNNTIFNFIARVFDLSSPRFHKENQSLIFQILISNNYPKKTINKFIKKYYNKKQTTDLNSNKKTEENDGKIYKSFMYVKGMSEQVENVMKIHNPNLHLAYKNPKCVRNVFTKLKDKIAKCRQTNVIYKIPCLGSENGEPACQKSYVGQTKQYLEKRLKNHRRDLQNAGGQSIAKTALVDHCIKEGHQPNFGAAEVLARAEHYSRRLTMEALHIINENSINFKRDTDNISPIYCSIINDKKRKAHMINENNRIFKKRRIK